MQHRRPQAVRPGHAGGHCQSPHRPAPGGWPRRAGGPLPADLPGAPRLIEEIKQLVISTYSVAGAAFGYAPLWTALFSFPLMTAVQIMCARLGMVTGRGLAGGSR